MLLQVLLCARLIAGVLAVNFDYENIRLTEAETRNYSSIRFAYQRPPAPERDCRYIPGDKQWPSVAEWARFNDTLGGALLKPLPLAAVCYNGPNYDEAKCTQVKRMWTSMNQHSNHPISVMSQWSSGHSCVPTSNPNSTCTQGGYPQYVVNATNVRQIQMAVNFARNSNIRLVIKNSGHDFNGKSMGGNSLSVWVHSLKGYVFHPNYTSPAYSGRAVAYAGGFQSQEAGIVQSRHNITFLTAGGPTVGIAGGFLQTAGHSTYTSYYGLAADHVLSIQAVTASGRFVTASPTENEDLFWAFRGGGGGTYGVITSVIIKAFPRTSTAGGSITFSTVPSGNSNSTGLSLETFWNGMRAYWEFGPKICAAGGLGYNFIRHTSSGNTTGLTFTTSISLPNRSAAEYNTFMRPLLEKLNKLGVGAPIPAALQVRSFDNFDPYDNVYTAHHDFEKRNGIPSSTSHQRRQLGEQVGNTLIASRLFARKNFADAESIEEAHLAIREMVDVDKGGYTFHGMNYAPTLAVSGNPKNAVNPAFRTTVLHAQAYEGDAHWDNTAPQRTFAEQKRRHDRLQSYMDQWKDITRGGGSYMNEGDCQEPDWKQAFYGSNYPRLRNIKEEWDPWSVFWAISAVGSDDWELRGSIGGGRNGVFTQDGRLCRA